MGIFQGVAQKLMQSQKKSEDPRLPSLLRAYRGETSHSVGAFCDDYSFLIRGLLDLFEASSDVQVSNSLCDQAFSVQNSEHLACPGAF